MRNLSSAALAKIANNMGNEPIVIIEVEWVRNSNNRIAYSERNLNGIPGRILEVSSLDNVVNIFASSDSQEITVVLDDTDGNIRDIMDNNDIHKRDVWVYQWFEGLDLSDKFLLFKGKINSPVVWSERERTVSFTVISQIEDVEIGFSPEEGQFENISPELLGVPWPMCFGTVVHSRTVKITDSIIGILGDGFGIADFALKERQKALDAIVTYRYICTNPNGNALQAAMCRLIAMNRLASPLYKQARQAEADYYCQEQTQRDSFRVFDGEYFPRGTINLKIGNATLKGHFQGNTDIFRLHNLGWYYRYNHPEWPNFKRFPLLFGTEHAENISRYLVTCNEEVEENRSKIMPYPESTGPIVVRWAGTSTGRPHLTGRVIGDNAGYVYLKPGSRVELADSEDQQFVVSIVPGTVIAVTAWAQREGQRFLQDVPENYYSVETKTFGTISAVIVTLNEALSKYEDMGWEDDIYVTFQSDVGPNTVDVIKYLIDTYTNFTYDSTTFNHVRTAIDNYPSHFTIYDRKNILTALQEIAWQANCAIWLKNDVFYIRYLPEEPTTVSTISRADILTNSLELSHTDTEDIITKMVCEWNASGAQENPFRTTLRHNVAKYGLHSGTFDYYIYNYADSIIKSATYWLIRYSNTWKRLQFKTPLTKLNLETFDPININLIGILANQIVTTLVEKANYDSDDHSLIFECWTPVKAGTMSQYVFAYPADAVSTETFPTNYEIQEGFAGSGSSKNQGARGILPETNPIVYTAKLLPDKEEDPFNLKYTDEETGEEDNRKIGDQGNPTPSNADDYKPKLNPYIERQLGEEDPGPDSKDLKGETHIPPDGWGNDYPGGSDSALRPDDIIDPTDPEFDPNDLPDPDDIPDSSCNFTVTIWYMDPVEHVLVGGSAYGSDNRTCGTIGQALNGQLTPVEDREVYVFNSCEMAKAFGAAMREYAEGENAEVCKSHPYMVWFPETCPQGECEEPSDPQMIAYRPNGSASGSSWSDYAAWAGDKGYTDGSWV